MSLAASVFNIGKEDLKNYDFSIGVMKGTFRHLL